MSAVRFCMTAMMILVSFALKAPVFSSAMVDGLEGWFVFDVGFRKILMDCVLVDEEERRLGVGKKG